ncbi:MAG: type IV secretory system conjugative DNA transfer family protein [Nitrospirales bacterium]|nr:type IV secretory system conjugative DNA transfer family protein [Nitrospirales bacterium]
MPLIPEKKFAFYAYPSKPIEIAQTIRAAIAHFNAASGTYKLEEWEKNDVSGFQLTTPIFSKILTGVFLAADVTFINENVAFEIGYAIGAKKRVLLFLNNTHSGDHDLASNIGIFDTLGHEEYDGSQTLAALLLKRTDFSPIDFEMAINHQQPVYIVEPFKKNDAHLMLVSRTKKARWKYRSFNPDEDVRMSALDAIRHVTQSAGVIAPLQPLTIQSAREQNIRAMFVAGLAIALEIPTLVIHPAEFSPPLDIRDVSKKYHHPDDIKDAIQAFSLEITDFSQQARSTKFATSTVLTKLFIGDPTAENEMTTLSDYYLSTDEYQRALRGEVNLVVGRKGSGKTALFVQLRDTKRARKPNIVIDLKPEGFQLVKLKELVLDFLSAGAQQHLITALWEYVLLLEVTYKVLEKDREVHLRNHTLTAPYQALRDFYGHTELSQEGDFRERLTKLTDHLIDEFFVKFDPKNDRSDKNAHLNVTTDQVTEILYQHDIRKLYDSLITYLHLKEEVWLLFDNIDKGWNVEGISDADIVILRCLINASRKMERELKGRKIRFHAIVFVRDDVYSLLMQGSSDYGKEMRASLDWSDPDLLGEVLKRRIIFSLNANSKEEIPDAWRHVCISHHSGEPWLSLMAGRSLMRPRNLLKLFRYSLGYAINMEHQKIESEDITRGLRTYAQDLVVEVDRELSDVFPRAKKLVYEFSEENAEFSHEELSTLIQCTGLDASTSERVITFLLYYGVLGVKKGFEEEGRQHIWLIQPFGLP